MDSAASSRTVLLGWELGGGLGHLRRLARLAKELAANGLRPVFAVKDLPDAQLVLGADAGQILQAPRFQKAGADRGRRFIAAGFADILATRGFGSVEELLPLVRGWDRLIECVQPALVVCDYSPALTLACYGRLPTILVGNGFTLPPIDRVAFPPLLLRRALLVSEEKVLGVIQEVQRRRGRESPATLPGLFAGAERFVMVIPQLDPYQKHRQEAALGPLDLSHVEPLPPPDGLAFFAYLNARMPRVERALAGLAASSQAGIVYLHGSSAAQRERGRRLGLEVLDRPASLDELLPRVRIVVHNGGVGLAQHALAAGRPQVILPDHLEHILYGQMLQLLGVGKYLAGEFGQQDVKQTVQEALTDQGFTERAQGAARQLQRTGPWNPLPGVVERCLAASIRAGIVSGGIGQTVADASGSDRSANNRPEQTVGIVSRSDGDGQTVLLGWELGDGLGHVRPLLRLARELAARGYRPVFAVRGLSEAVLALGDATFPVVPAPLWPHRRTDPSFVAASYADILAVRGYDSVENLLAMVRGWQGLLDLLRPGLVVCDHSPTLCLAAYRSVPTIVLGNGFFVPPADGTIFPALKRGQTPLVPEARLLAVVQEVQRLRGCPAPETLPGLFAAAERFVTVLPELDPYLAVRNEQYAGPLEHLPSEPLPPGGAGFFAYLNASASCLEPLLAELAGTGSGKTYLRGAGPALRERVQRLGFEVFESPAAIADVLPGVAVVVHHGGAGLAQYALAAGRPQVVFPLYLEQQLNAARLQELGVGRYLAGAFPAGAARAALRHVLTEPSVAATAQAVAWVIHGCGPWIP